MGTRTLLWHARRLAALSAGLVGCNAILDNPKGELAANTGASSQGGFASSTTNSSQTGGSAAGASSAVDTTATTTGGAAIGGASASNETGGNPTLGGTSTVANGATGGTSAAGGTTSATGGFTTANGGSLGTATLPMGGSAATGGVPATGGASSTVSLSVVFSAASVSDAASTNLTTANFQFSSTPASASAFKCKLNTAATFTDCTSGLALRQLSAGPQALLVYAVDGAGNAGPTTTRTWTITPLSTTIKDIRAGSFDDYLVSVSNGVRLTGFGTESGQQVIFVQELGPAANLVVDSMANLSGNVILNSGILTRPAATQPEKAEGTTVTVVGTVIHNGAGLEIARASYTWSTTTTLPYNLLKVRTAAVFAAGLEGVHIALSGQIPATNCGSDCFNNQVGNNNRCIETTCVDASCATNATLTWLNIAGSASHAVTSGYGVWRGWLVKRGSYYELWTTSSDSFADATTGCKT